jgi:hypothetical protein
LRLTKERKELLDKGGANTLFSRHDQQIPILYSRVYDIVRKWADSPNVYHLRLAFEAAVGTRATGIIDRSIGFGPATGEGHQLTKWVKQYGVLKDKEYTAKVEKVYDQRRLERKVVSAQDYTDLHAVGRHVEKPIAFGLDYNWVMKTLNTIRTTHTWPIKPNSKSRAEVGRSYNADLTAAFKEEFDPILKDNIQQRTNLGSHFLRMIYVNVSFRYFEDSIKQSLSAFITHVLGHGSPSMKTALSYQTIKMIWSLPPNIAEGVEPRSINNALLINALEKRMDKHQDQTMAQLLVGMKPSTLIMNSRKRGLQSIALPGKEAGKMIKLLFYQRRLGKFDTSLRLAQQAVKMMRLVANLNVNAQALRNLGFGYKTAAAVFRTVASSKVPPKRKRDSTVVTGPRPAKKAKKS